MQSRFWTFITKEDSDVFFEKDMKILHLIPDYVPAKAASGPISTTHALNTTLVKLGVDVTVYTSNRDGNGVMDVVCMKPQVIDGVRVVYFPARGSWYYSRELREYLTAHAAEFDVIHETSVFLYFSYLASRVAKKFKKPLVLTVHGTLMEIPLSTKSFKKKVYLALVEKSNIASSVMHFTVENELRDFLRLGLHSKENVIIPNVYVAEEHFSGVTSEMRNRFRSKYGIGGDKKVVLFLGRLHPIKGLDTLVPAFKAVHDEMPEAILVIAGFGDYLDTAETMVKELKLQDGVIFTGPLWGRDKIDAHIMSDLYVQPSYTEAFSMALVEAMHYSLPVIVTETNGLASYVRNAKAGMVVKKEEEAITKAILEILRDKDKAKEMAEKGAGLVRDVFSPRAIASAFVDLYTRLSNT